MNAITRLAKLEQQVRAGDAVCRCRHCGSTLAYVVTTDASDTTRCSVCGAARDGQILKAYIGIDPALV